MHAQDPGHAAKHLQAEGLILLVGISGALQVSMGDIKWSDFIKEYVLSSPSDPNKPLSMFKKMKQGEFLWLDRVLVQR